MNEKNPKTEIESKLEAFKKAKCTWPECNDKQFMAMSLPLVKVLENGSIDASEGMHMAIPFCFYHSIIVGNGLFGITDTVDSNDHQLVGPFDSVEHVESVIAAMAMSGKLGDIIEKAKQAKEAMNDKK